MPGDKNSNFNSNGKCTQTSFHVPIEVLIRRVKNKLEKLSNNHQFSPEVRAQMKEQSDKYQAQLEDLELMSKFKEYEKKSFSP